MDVCDLEIDQDIRLSCAHPGKHEIMSAHCLRNSANVEPASADYPDRILFLSADNNNLVNNNQTPGKCGANTEKTQIDLGMMTGHQIQLEKHRSIITD